MYEYMQLAVRKTKIYYNSSCLKYCTPGPQQSYETPNVSTGILITTAYTHAVSYIFIYMMEINAACALCMGKEMLQLLSELTFQLRPESA